MEAMWSIEACPKTNIPYAYSRTWATQQNMGQEHVHLELAWRPSGA